MYVKLRHTERTGAKESEEIYMARRIKVVASPHYRHLRGPISTVYVERFCFYFSSRWGGIRDG